MLVSALLALVVSSGDAHAQSMALEPQNRLHVGVNVQDGPSGVGLSLGLDSRLTRIISLDVAAFASPVPIPEDYTWDGAADASTPEYYRLRHGVYAMPGLRIPHPQPKRWAWDIFLRAGGGVIWAANLSPDAVSDTDDPFVVRPDVAGAVGTDAVVRFGRFGVRAAARAWMFDVVQTLPAETFFTYRFQGGLEGLVQF